MAKKFIKFETSAHKYGQKNGRFLPGEIDTFLVFCPDNDKIYSVPANHHTCVSSPGILRVDPPGNHMKTRIFWAIEYELK